MRKLTIHTTDLDSWIWYNRVEDMPVQEMAGRLLRTEQPNFKMMAGTAWHNVMENPPSEFDNVISDGFKFRIDCEADIVLPQCREIRASKTYQIDGVEVKVTGKCDGISGNKLSDHKLTFRSSPENYLESLQWRSYMDIFNADIFEYIIYLAKEEKDGTIAIHDISEMKVYRYPKLVEDLERSMVELIDFIKVHVPEMIK